MTSAPASRPVRWGLGQVWAGAGLALLGALVVTVVLLVVWVVNGSLDTSGTPEELNAAVLALTFSAGPVALLFLAQWAGPMAAVWWASYKRGRRSLAEDFGLRIRWVDVPLGIAVAAVVRGVEYLVSLVLDALGSDAFAQADNASYLSTNVGWSLVVVALVVVLLGPFAEELFFRGLLLRSLLKRRPEKRFRKASAVLVTSLVFGLAHTANVAGGFTGVITIFLLTGLVGAALGTLAVRTGRLGPSLVTHVTYNALAVVLVVAS